ncbi:MAG TPA: PIG-L family deacetylase [Terriglobales bacterium]|nr:PIG-L family deacetylase [Terriglobales bacterium]
MKWQADRERRWREISARLETETADSNLRIVVLAAHPDDETIGASLLLSRFPKSSVVFLTDGAPKNTKLWPPGMRGSKENYADLRREEAVTALSIAGISEKAIFWLGGVDQEAVFEIRPLGDEFRQILMQTRADLVITHPYEGGHPDHDAAAVVACIAASSLDNPPVLLEMTSYHARNGQCVTGEFLNSEQAQQMSFKLSESDRDLKRRMIHTYVSQRLVLENFPVAEESLRLMPTYNFSQPPHEGQLWYEIMGWMAGDRWRETVRESVIETLAKHQVQACR